MTNNKKNKQAIQDNKKELKNVHFFGAKKFFISDNPIAGMVRVFFDVEEKTVTLVKCFNLKLKDANLREFLHLPIEGDYTGFWAINKISNNCFMNCHKITGILKLTDKVEKIKSNGFRNCSNLTLDLKNAKNLKIIGKNAFQGIGKLIYK